MDNPTILFEAAKRHHGEIQKEMASWRMAHQAKNARPGRIGRLVVASKAFIKKMMAQQTRETYSQDEDLILNTHS